MPFGDEYQRRLRARAPRVSASDKHDGVVLGEPVLEERVRYPDRDARRLRRQQRVGLEPGVEAVPVNLGLDSGEDLVPDAGFHDVSSIRSVRRDFRLRERPHATARFRASWQSKNPGNWPLSGHGPRKSQKNRVRFSGAQVKAAFSTMFSTVVEILGEKPNSLRHASEADEPATVAQSSHRPANPLTPCASDSSIGVWSSSATALSDNRRA